MATVISVRGRNQAELLADPSFVYVGRACAGWPASIWGNPFKVTDATPVSSAVDLFAEWLGRNEELLARLPELRGKTLGCWCVNWNGHGEPRKACHAVVLARMVNPVQRTLFS